VVSCVEVRVRGFRGIISGGCRGGQEAAMDRQQVGSEAGRWWHRLACERCVGSEWYQRGGAEVDNKLDDDS
jgi:hypothetical protein